MTEQTTAADTERAQRSKLLFPLWALLVLVFFAWQGAWYLGLVQRAGEWQFGGFGKYFPALTVMLVVILFGIPLFYIFSARANRHAAQDNPRDPARRFLKILSVLAGVFAVLAVLVAVLPLIRDALARGPEFALAVGTPADADPAPGPTKLSGTLLLNRAVVDHTWFYGYDRRAIFVPVIGRNGGKAPLRYFVQGVLAGPTSQYMTISGTLRRDALPGPIAQMYRDAGYQVPSKAYVLFTDRGVERFSYLVTAAAIAFAAIALAIAALFQRRRLSKISSGRRSGTAHAVG